MGNVVIVDDEYSITEALKKFFQMNGLSVISFQDSLKAYQYIKNSYEEVDLVITDLIMPRMDGHELFIRIKDEFPYIPVIIMSGKATVEDAISIMKEGVYDFFIKPFENIDKLILIARKAIEWNHIKREYDALKVKVSKDSAFSNIIGRTKKMNEIFDVIRQVAPTKATVMITGDTGSGKELIAESIHDLSGRKGQLIKVNCAALTESILESELFGHEKGAFTGAIKTKLGRFELANEGTLFLDEVAEISQNIQVKLLRVLQNKQFERVGGEQTIDVDVRIICATNKELWEYVKNGKFREDLYYRLNVIQIKVPSLKERIEDIPLLIKHFIERFSKENNIGIEGITPKAIKILTNYTWPGNVRELQNCIENMVVLSKNRILDFDDIPDSIYREVKSKPDFILEENDLPEEFLRIKTGIPLVDVEKQYLLHMLSKYKNKAKVAQITGIGRKTLYNKLEEWGMPPSINNENKG